MNRYFIIVLILSPILGFSKPGFRVSSLTCEYTTNPVGVESIAPKLSWKMIGAERNLTQSAYSILVCDNLKDLNRNIGNVWISGKVLSDKSIQIRYAGRPLESALKYYYKIKIWDNNNRESDWSEVSTWQMGLLKPADWKGAKWIGYEQMPQNEKIIPAVHLRGNFTEKNDILPLFRKTIDIRKKIKIATAFVSGLGHYELSLNGSKISDHFLDPGWTKYDQQALYVSFDLTKLLKKGKNAIGAILGNGFYFIPRDARYRKITGAFGYPKLICRIRVEYTDGSLENIVTDESWKTSPSPISYSSIYGGEDYDASSEQLGWDKPAFDDRNWKTPVILNDKPEMNSQMAEPVKIMEQFNPVKVTQIKPGVWVYDMGQNASAIPSMVVKGKRSDKIRITPGELLNPDGSVNQSASGDAHFYDYTLKGDGKEHWQPKFTYYGFRYLQLEGAVPKGIKNEGSKPILLALKSLHIRNAAVSTGSFNSSDELFNKTDKLIDWAIRSNMVSLFTDCPHREKLGWLEETHLMGGSVQYNYNIASLCKKVVKDMMISQTDEGLIPDIAPEYVNFGGSFRDSPEWGSSGIIVPWYVYQWYGDTDLLLESYPMMKRYIAYLQSKATGNILSHGLGDWFDIGPNNPGEAQLTPKSVTATAIYYYSLDIITKVAKLLNQSQDAEKYALLSNQVKDAFNNKFFNKATKEYATGSQTANAMAVYMNLVAPEDKAAVINNLVKEIKGRNNSLTAGDIGYRYVLRVLDDAGRSDVIYDMNSRSDVPGYGWQLAHGATALTESWQAYGFVSNNHFMLGHLMEWFYSGLAGIRTYKDAVAYKTLDIRPQIVGKMTHAEASFESPYGKVSSSWVDDKTGFSLNVEIPPNSFGVVTLPMRDGMKVYEGGKIVNSQKNNLLKINEKEYQLKIGSGKYHFKVL